MTLNPCIIQSLNWLTGPKFATTQKSVGVSESLPTSDMAAAVGTNHVQILVIENITTAAGISVDRYAAAQRFVGVSEQILTNDSVAAVLNKRRFTMVDSP